ncbi:hypothetical protein [Streptacidiphilus sp. EB129]|uniref:hypothetical protein n=1 Tax=Streptacidiphilus sp. EB129 TaxID=3156262 RepID=UPI0035125433
MTATIEKTGTTGKASQLKGLKHSKPGILFGMAGSAYSAFGVVKDIRKARREGDTLKLVNAAVGALALATGTLLLIRELRRLGDDDILAG